MLQSVLSSSPSLFLPSSVSDATCTLACANIHPPRTASVRIVALIDAFPSLTRGSSMPPFLRAPQVRITDEFFLQGDLERSRGMPITPICDRLKSAPPPSDPTAAPPPSISLACPQPQCPTLASPRTAHVHRAAGGYSKWRVHSVDEGELH
jgi:hypothetical protein